MLSSLKYEEEKKNNTYSHETFLRYIVPIHSKISYLFQPENTYTVRSAKLAGVYHDSETWRRNSHDEGGGGRNVVANCASKR